MVSTIFSMSGPVDLTMQTFVRAIPVFVPVAQAPIENAFSANNRSVGNENRIQLAVFLCTSWSSAAERSQLNGVPDEPADSSTTVPASGIRPFRERSAKPYFRT